MLVKAKTIEQKIKPLEEVEVVLNPDDAYYLIGVLGATTDKRGEKLYNALIDSVGSATGESSSLIYSRNEIAREGFANVNKNRFSTVTAATPEPQTITFVYEGLTRVVKDPTFDGNLLKGFELTRGARATNQFKSYRTEKIGSRSAKSPLAW